MTPTDDYLPRLKEIIALAEAFHLPEVRVHIRPADLRSAISEIEAGRKRVATAEADKETAERYGTIVAGEINDLRAQLAALEGREP